MLWTFLLIVLLCAIAGVLWVRHRQEQEWLRELTYLSRHEAEAEAEPAPEAGGGKPPKALRGVDPNLQNTRQSYRAAEEAKAVYDKTVEKFRALSPKHSRKLDATSGAKRETQQEDDFNELPIFAAAPKIEAAPDPEFAEAGSDAGNAEAPIRALKAEPLPEHAAGQDEAAQGPSENENIPAEEGGSIPMFGAVLPEEPETAQTTAPKSRGITGKAIDIAPYVSFDENEYRPSGKPVDASLPVITLEEATRSLHETHLADRAQSEAEPPAPKPFSNPSPDMEVVELNWQFRPALEEAAPPKPVIEPKVIGLDDPALVRTRERVLSEVRQLSHSVPRTEMTQSVAQALDNPETIGEDDIRSNLLRQRLARRRQVSAQAPVQVLQPKVIPEGEVFANLAKTDSPVNRQRIRRVNIAMRESVIPDAARVEQSHSVQLQPAKPAAATPPISTRFTPFATVPDAHATVVEPPPVPEVERQVIDIPEPPVFQHNPPPLQTVAPRAAEYAEQASAHISSRPSWSITDRLLQESAPESEQPPAFQTAADTVLNRADETTAAVFEHNAPKPAAEIFRPSEAVPAGIAGVVQSQAGAGEPHLPTVALLQPPQFDPSATQTEEALLENSITIEEKLAEFKVKVKVMDAYAGPVITRYEIEPDVGVRGNAVMNLEKDLARSLGVASIRVVETIPGKTCMGLELPNPKRQMIRLSEIFNSPAFQESKSKLTLALGQDITGEPVVTDLAKAPHLLVAGTTGSGKSVGVNSMILSMLFKATPDEVRMIMIDPKMLELSIYEGIPHLLAPVVTDMKLAANALTWCVNEMEKRYRLMSHMGVRNVAGFNQKVAEAAARGEKLVNPFTLTPEDPEPLEKLPFIVVVVDEFADLMMTAGKKIEELIARLAQKARAAGIHLILATQRPSVDVITGLIKANIPTRIAFQVSSKVDSRTILDQMGAENLLGQGDMLFLPPGTGYPRRVHGAFVADEEVHHVVEYLKQFGEPNYIDDILTAGVGGDDLFSNANGQRSGDEEQDPMYDDAVACVIKTRKATISSVQRYLRIGYNRAARLIDQMEADGIVSAPEANGNRTVLAQSSEHLD
ncbi:cell division protein FtsK [Neisseria dentiae]|uniref:Cell division protein FtsK n=2 Tax=Neisseria dentiae TaxID=194197 RepID=A0A1X3D641_9NEIS|nr:DNA translocase FtsK [Neisseria dentiae]OSI15215.1 cell division protein FtsK [Neisseria dentiae]QMT46433.1 cell division protein FtsK [Neisseria dentiae]STZ51753.1 putative cell-division protein [Neisseria dentiae]